MIKKKPKKPPQDLPEEVPLNCRISVYLGGYCEEVGLRNPLMRRMLHRFKQEGKIALEDWHNYVIENWPGVKAETEAKMKKKAELERGED